MKLIQVVKKVDAGRNGDGYRVINGNLVRCTHNGAYETLANVSSLNEAQRKELLELIRANIPSGIANAREKAKEMIKNYKTTKNGGM